MSNFVIPSREDLAWAAGFFDGEGHIGLATTGAKKLNRHLHIQVVQTEEGPLERLQTIIGGKLYGPYPHGKRKPYKQLHIDKFEDVQHVVCLLWPWLSRPKREQVKNALAAFHEYQQRPYVPRGPRPKENAA